MRVLNIMSPDVVTLSPNATVAEAAETLRKHSIHHLVIAEKHHLFGVVSDTDLLNASFDGAGDRPVSEIMSRTVTTIAPSETIRHAASVMSGNGVRCLPVVEDGVLRGIITTADLLRALSKGNVHLAPQSERKTMRSRGPQVRPPYV